MRQRIRFRWIASGTRDPENGIQSPIRHDANKVSGTFGGTARWELRTAAPDTFLNHAIVRNEIPKECPMSTADVTIEMLEFVRTRTLMTLDEVAKLPDPLSVLKWQPAPGRAHIGWQLTHIGITEELTAMERLSGKTPNWPELVPRFKMGSTPDQNVPDIATIRNILEVSRSHLIPCIARMKDSELDVIPEWYRERGWSQRRIMQILIWHESHHQGQAHLTLNLWKAAHPTS